MNIKRKSVRSQIEGFWDSKIVWCVLGAVIVILNMLNILMIGIGDVPYDKMWHVFIVVIEVGVLLMALFAVNIYYVYKVKAIEEQQRKDEWYFNRVKRMWGVDEKMDMMELYYYIYMEEQEKKKKEVKKEE